MVLKLARVAGEAITYTQPGLQMRVEIVSVHRTGTRVLINGRPDTLRPGRPIALWPGVWIQMTGTSGREVRIASAAPPEVVIMRAELEVRHAVRLDENGEYRCSCGAGWPRHKGPDHPA